MKSTAWNVVGVLLGVILILMALSGAPLIFPQTVAVGLGATSIALNVLVLYIKARTEEN